jgi:hypothetical protein
MFWLNIFLVKRKQTITTLIVIIPIGFYTKFYSGPASEWVNNSLGGILYVIFWSLLFFLLAPKVNPIKIASIVFILTCTLEFLQLWHPNILESFRSNFLGRTILGSSFSWLDFLHYFVGFIISFALIKHFYKTEVKMK